MGVGDVDRGPEFFLAHSRTIRTVIAALPRTAHEATAGSGELSPLCAANYEPHDQPLFIGVMHCGRVGGNPNFQPAATIMRESGHVEGEHL